MGRSLPKHINLCGILFTKMTEELNQALTQNNTG